MTIYILMGPKGRCVTSAVDDPALPDDELLAQAWSRFRRWFPGLTHAEAMLTLDPTGTFTIAGVTKVPGDIEPHEPAAEPHVVQEGLQKVETYQCRDCGQFWDPSQAYGPTKTIDQEGMKGTIAFILPDGGEEQGARCPHCGSYNSRIAKSSRVGLDDEGAPAPLGAAHEPVQALQEPGDTQVRLCPLKSLLAGQELTLGPSPDQCSGETCEWWCKVALACSIRLLADKTADMMEVASLIAAIPPEDVAEMFGERDDDDDQAEEDDDADRTIN